MEDEDLVSRSFLTVFFMDINNLKDSLAGYRSIMLRLNYKAFTDPKKLEEALAGLKDDMKNAVIQWSDSVRHNVERCQIAAEALQGAIPEIKTDGLTKDYDKIMSLFTLDLDVVSNYTFEVNKVFVKGTIEKVLNKMESFYEQFVKK